MENEVQNPVNSSETPGIPKETLPTAPLGQPPVSNEVGDTARGVSGGRSSKILILGILLMIASIVAAVVAVVIR